ncbi:hypothetical protein BASA81_010127 [Batrachochytrium salamandrivorans]|nr:hypothetical protein BASA81_010127 [Batrachochytrium salamandrivorans]
MNLRHLGLGLVLAGLGVVTLIVLAVLFRIKTKPVDKEKDKLLRIVVDEHDDDAKEEQAQARAVVITPRSRTTADNIDNFRKSMEDSSPLTSTLRKRTSATSLLERRPSIISRVLRGSPTTSPTALEDVVPVSPRATAVTLLSSDPKPIYAHNSLDGHFDSVESLAFSQEEGYFATGGGPEDGFIRLYDKKLPKDLNIGPIRHVINVRQDCQKHDTASALSFAMDEGKKTTLLLAGTKAERFLMGYKISRNSNTLPQLMFCIETGHGGPISSVVGFIPRKAVNYADPGVWFATSAMGTREVKLWGMKHPSHGPLLVIDAECWAAKLRVSPNGQFLAVLSNGGGPGQLFELRVDPKTGSLKALKQKLNIPISESLALTPQSPISASGSSGGVLPRLAKASEFQICQDLHFAPDNGKCTVACCRSDSAIWIGSAMVGSPEASWELQVLLRPESLQGTPSHLLTLVHHPGKTTRVLVAKGKDVYFFDHSLVLLGVLRGRREDGDVIGMELSPTADLLVVVAFGGSVARVVSVA